MNQDRVWHYNKGVLVKALISIGVQKGDIIFSHVSLGRLGYPEEGSDIKTACGILWEAFMEVLGDQGTLLIPTYTYSIGKREIYDVQNSPSTVGPFTEYFRLLPGVVRSRDPMLAVSGIGPKSKDLLTNLPKTCYGEGSVYDRMRKAGAKICNVGISLYWATFRHHIEELARVPFRFKKLFTGYIQDRGEMSYEGWTYFAAPFVANCNPDGMRLDRKARSLGKCKAVGVGRSEIVCIDAQQYFEFGMDELAKDPWYTAQGPPCDTHRLIELEDERVGGKRYEVTFPDDCSIEDMIRVLWPLPRDLVSAGIDASLAALRNHIPMTIQEFLTGSQFEAHLVPEKWTCLEGYLERQNGRKLLSYSDNYLHVASYSQAFDGIVKRDELLQHLKVHPSLPDAVPYHNMARIRDWGLCCSRAVRDSLTDASYRVFIRSAFSFSTLKVGEVSVKGDSDDTVLICAHIDHVVQANDGLSGVVVGMAAMRELMRSRSTRSSYRFVIVPGVVGILAYLSRNKAVADRVKGCIILDMLGHDYPHLLRLSNTEGTDFDSLCSLVLTETEKESKIERFSEGTGDETFWLNEIRVDFPVLSLTRALKTTGLPDDCPFPEYHSHLDTPERINYKKLDGSVKLLLSIIKEWDERA